MKKGQSLEKKIKNILKFFKMNENAISTVMGAVVVLVVAGLIFNYFRTTNLKTWQGILNTDNGASTTAETQKNDDVIDTYKVVKGDDLWHIAEKYYKSGYNYVDIIKENKLRSDGAIEIGMELRIPKVEAKEATVKAETAKVFAETKQETKTIEAGEYVTAKGDSYWKIALRSYGDGYAWVKIYEANKKIFADPNVIYANVKIVIPSLK